MTAASLRALPESEPLLGPGGWLGFQTFWGRGEDGRLWAARRFRLSGSTPQDVHARFPAVAATVAQEWAQVTGRNSIARVSGHGARRDWRRASTRSMPRDAWGAFLPATVERTAEPAPFASVDAEPCRVGHGVVLGASGAGKTWFLAERASRAILRQESVVAIDLHGDLAPAIVARLPAGARRRVVAVDALDRPLPGIAALAGSDERSAAHLVAAIKRLSADGTDIYWGFRLERIFDAFVRIVQESGGSLHDLYALLADADRRDAARLASRSTDLVRFLEELAPIARRNPDFLWAAAARLSKVVLVPALAELLSPADGGLPVEELLEGGRSLLVRLPFATLGPEAASFAGTLVLARVYLGLATRGSARGRCPAVLTVLDEVQGLSPRLVSEVLAEGRKFGLRLLLASQYPERLAPEASARCRGRRPGRGGVPRTPAKRCDGRWMDRPYRGRGRPPSDGPSGGSRPRAGPRDRRDPAARARSSARGHRDGCVGWGRRRLAPGIRPGGAQRPLRIDRRPGDRAAPARRPGRGGVGPAARRGRSHLRRRAAPRPLTRPRHPGRPRPRARAPWIRRGRPGLGSGSTPWGNVASASGRRRAPPGRAPSTGRSSFGRSGRSPAEATSSRSFDKGATTRRLPDAIFRQIPDRVRAWLGP